MSNERLRSHSCSTGINQELRHLEHFVTGAEERNFTRAARRLHLVHSALSVSVRSLERELDTQLFERSTRRVRLTDAGRMAPADKATCRGNGDARTEETRSAANRQTGS